MANQSFTASIRMTAMSGKRLARPKARGFLPAHLDGDKPRCCELYDCLDDTDSETDKPLKPSVAEAAGKT
ncbi:MAG TPA: hypothetical protein VGB85_09020, partial [Nannocystis sp.]